MFDFYRNEFFESLQLCTKKKVSSFVITNIMKAGCEMGALKAGGRVGESRQMAGHISVPLILISHPKLVVHKKSRTFHFQSRPYCNRKNSLKTHY